MISPGLSSCEHTLNTLRYADRVKELETTSLSKAGAGGDDDRVDNVVVVDVTPTKVGKMEAARVMTPSESDLVLLHESLKRVCWVVRVGVCGLVLMCRRVRKRRMNY